MIHPSQRFQMPSARSPEIEFYSPWSGSCTISKVQRLTRITVPSQGLKFQQCRRSPGGEFNSAIGREGYRGPTRPDLCSLVDSEHLHKFCHLAEMTECVARRLVVAAQKVDIEHILPGTSSHRPGLDLTQADVAQRKDT